SYRVSAMLPAQIECSPLVPISRLRRVVMSGFVLKIRRAETPGYALLKKIAVRLLRIHIPVPQFFRPVLRAIYTFHWTILRACRRLYIFAYAEPLFRGRCDRVGAKLFLWALPDVRGHTHIEIGDDVSISGKIGVFSGRTHEYPKLMIG